MEMNHEKQNTVPMHATFLCEISLINQWVSRKIVFSIGISFMHLLAFGIIAILTFMLPAFIVGRKDKVETPSIKFEWKLDRLLDLSMKNRPTNS